MNEKRQVRYEDDKEHNPYRDDIEFIAMSTGERAKVYGVYERIGDVPTKLPADVIVLPASDARMYHTFVKSLESKL